MSEIEDDFGASERRRRFRHTMRRLDPAAGPRQALTEGLYVAPFGRAVADEVAGRLEIKPVSSHLVLGGPGTGKSTQLLLACARLARVPDTTAVYIDMAERGDLQAPKSFSVPMLAAEALLHEAVTGGDAVDQALLARCKEWFADIWGKADERPLSDVARDVCAELGKLTSHIVVVLDSLDRIAPVAMYSEIASGAIEEILGWGVGVVVTGPKGASETLLDGAGRTVRDRVDRCYDLSPASQKENDRDAEFLMQVVYARLPENACTEAACRRIAELSGGVLRDLIALAEAAVEDAYVAGADVVDVAHVDRAASSRRGRPGP